MGEDEKEVKSTKWKGDPKLRRDDYIGMMISEGNKKTEKKKEKST